MLSSTEYPGSPLSTPSSVMPPTSSRLPPAPARRRKGRAVVVLSALGLAGVAAVLAAPLSAQSSSPSANAFAEAALGLSRLHEKAAWTASGAALLTVTPRLSIGGSGTVVLGSHSLPGSTPGNDLELRMAFGGLAGQLALLRRDDRTVWVRLLAGAGNAKMDLAVVGTQIASDNFGVVVPEVGATLRLVGPIHLGGALGYRATFGVEDLPGLAPSDLRGLSARVLVAVHRF